MSVPVSGKICQSSESFHRPKTYINGPLHRCARLKIAGVEMLGREDCKGDMWKNYGLEEAPECDDFDFWKQVFIAEGIKAPNWKAAIAEAKTLSPEGMAWGTTLSDREEDYMSWS